MQLQHSRRRADWLLAVGVGEDHRLAGERIEVRGRDLRVVVGQRKLSPQVVLPGEGRALSATRWEARDRGGRGGGEAAAVAAADDGHMLLPYRSPPPCGARSCVPRRQTARRRAREGPPQMQGLSSSYHSEGAQSLVGTDSKPAADRRDRPLARLLSIIYFFFKKISRLFSFRSDCSYQATLPGLWLSWHGRQRASEPAGRSIWQPRPRRRNVAGRHSIGGADRHSVTRHSLGHSVAARVACAACAACSLQLQCYSVPSRCCRCRCYSLAVQLPPPQAPALRRVPPGARAAHPTSSLFWSATWDGTMCLGTPTRWCRHCTRRHSSTRRSQSRRTTSTAGAPRRAPR